MDHVLENKFLSKEAASKLSLQEVDDEETKLISGNSQEEV